MSPSPAALKLPASYATLPFKQIRLSHVPATSPSPTKVILLTLYRPENKNAFTYLMATELASAFDLLSSEPRVRCIVVTGHGGAFCVGADMGGDSELAASKSDGRKSNSRSEGGIGTSGNENILHERTAEEIQQRAAHRDGGGLVTLAIHRCTKPVIAAINGHAVGVGITMTLPMTIRIASEQAKIGFVFARRGIVMEAASSFFLPRLIGFSRALHVVTTGAVYPATDPLLGTLFSETLPPDRVLPRALELAGEIAANTSSVSTSLMRDLMYRGPGTAEEAHLLDSQVLWEVFRGRDVKEGVGAFLEKRAPRFGGDLRRDGLGGVWPWWEEVDTSVKGNIEGNGKKEKEKSKL